MALNWAMLAPDRTPVPLPNEMTITTIDTGAEITIIIPDAPPSPTATSGGKGGTKKLKQPGRLWLTDQRLIFVTLAKSSFDSLSVPLPSILATKFEQPLLGANYLSLDVKPSPEGGLTDGTKAELRVTGQGLFGLTSVLEKTRERAIYMKRQHALEEEGDGLPEYTSPATQAGPSVSAGFARGMPSPMPPVPDDAPPGYEA